jgi:hypothetical protein
VVLEGVIGELHAAGVLVRLQILVGELDLEAREALGSE